jgi:uncharacterized membrane protein (TIGR02234 family)
MTSKGLAFGCLLAGGGLALIASVQPWWRGVGEAAMVDGGATLTGSQATGGLSQALGIVALAGTLLMLALRSRGRRVVAALLLLIGVGIVLVGGYGLQPRPNAVRGQLGHIGLLDTLGLTATAWPWIFAVAGLPIAAGAALTMITAGSWPAGSGRFQPDSGTPPPAMSEEPVELWKAMDAGVDPTTDDHDTLIPADPKMRDRKVGDTMDGTEQAQQLPNSPRSPSSGQAQQGRGERET